MAAVSLYQLMSVHGIIPKAITTTTMSLHVHFMPPCEWGRELKAGRRLPCSGFCASECILGCKHLTQIDYGASELSWCLLLCP